MLRNQQKNPEQCRKCQFFYKNKYCHTDTPCKECPNSLDKEPYCKCMEKSHTKECPYYKEAKSIYPGTNANQFLESLKGETQCTRG